MKAIWNNQIIAESDKTIIVENNHYFPKDSVNMDFMIDSNTESICPWKGQASYYTIVVGDKKNVDAAWFYQNPRPLAKNIKNYIAFWKGVEIIT